jgi:hypothetical protein
MTDVSAQQKPTTGYAPVNGINLLYEVHGGGEPQGGMRKKWADKRRVSTNLAVMPASSK